MELPVFQKLVSAKTWGPENVRGRTAISVIKMTSYGEFVRTAGWIVVHGLNLIVFISSFRLTNTQRTTEASLAWDIMSVVKGPSIQIRWFSLAETPSTVATEPPEILLLIGIAGMMLSPLLSLNWTNCKNNIHFVKIHYFNTHNIGLCSGVRILSAPIKPTSTLRWLATLLSLLEKTTKRKTVKYITKYPEWKDKIWTYLQ